MLGFQLSEAESGPGPCKLNKMSCHCHELYVCLPPLGCLFVCGFLMNLPAGSLAFISPPVVAGI